MRTYIYIQQDAMENFVFPDEMKTILKMFMNIFPILTGIPQKSCKGHFLFSLNK